MPFEVLSTNGDQYLIDHYHISYLGSGRDLLRLKMDQRMRRSSPPLVIADPDFDLKQLSLKRSTHHELRDSQNKDDDNGSVQPSLPQARTSGARGARSDSLHFRRLEGTRLEGLRIAELLKVTPWLEQEALEGRVKAVCSPEGVQRAEIMELSEPVNEYHSPYILHIATHGFFLADQLRNILQDEVIGASGPGAGWAGEKPPGAPAGEAR